MKLVLYGGGLEEENEDLDLAALDLSASDSPTITYIPSSSHESYTEFRSFARQHSKYGVTRLLYFPIDTPFDDILFREVFKSDIIHLAGGNTYYFLNTLRRKKLLGPVREFVKKGRVLSGLSAGAILMTPSIHTAIFPSFDCDENEENLKNWKALNLVKFEFFPHYRNSRRYEQCLKRESRKRHHPIYACPDSHGVVIENDTLQFLGRCFAFQKGSKVILSS